MANIKHNGGIVDSVLELGFDQVKYFEGSVGTTATGFNISPPARKLMLQNKSESGNLYLRVDGNTAEPVVSFVPGDNIKIGPQCSFVMDFDTLSSISLISDTSGGVSVEGLLGFKGTTC